MRITESVKTIVITENVLGIVCNKCGKSSVPDYTNTVQAFDLTFGYGSNYDGHRIQFDICELCLEKMMREFKIQVNVID